MSYREDAGSARAHDLLVVALEGRVVGLGTADGQIRWSNELPGGGIGAVSLIVEEQHVFASPTGRKVFCLDRQTGDTLWSAETGASGEARMLRDGDLLLVAKGGEVDGFSLAGRHLWRQPLTGMGIGLVTMGVPGHTTPGSTPER